MLLFSKSKKKNPSQKELNFNMLIWEFSKRRRGKMWILKIEKKKKRKKNENWRTNAATV